MPRARNNENRGYPKSWRFRYDAYYYRVPKGQEHLWDGKNEFNLGRSLSEAERTLATTPWYQWSSGLAIRVTNTKSPPGGS